MKATDNQDVSGPLRLTLQQQRVLDALKDRDTEEYPLSRWYLGALHALNDEQNPDRISQAAQSLRELLEKLPRVVLGLGIQGGTSDFVGMRRSIIKRILKDKNRYSKGWLNEKIDAPLAKTLKKIVRYFELNQQPTRKQQIQTAVAALDPMSNLFDRKTQEKKRDEFNNLWQRLEHFAHHKTYPNLAEFGSCLKDIEKAVFDLLAPITAENQKEIQTILGNANRSETDVENMFELIERRGANYVFFFKHAAENADTAWLTHLDKRGYFADLPNTEPIGNDRVNFPFSWRMHYLRKIAPHAPDEVVQIVLRLPKSDNPRIYYDILEIALQLHGSHSARLEPKILEYVNLENYFFANRFADVLVHWTAENQTATALKLAEVLVKFVPDPEDMVKRKRREIKSKNSADIAAMVVETYLHPSPRFGDMDYLKILSDGVRPLAQKEPLKVALILINATAKMIRLRTHQDDLNKNVDYSEYWCERLSESEGDYEDSENSLVHSLSFACQQVYEKRPDSILELDDALRDKQWRIFKRLCQHLYAKYPSEQTKPWIRELILEHEDYHRWVHRYEFQQTIRSACEHFGAELLTKQELKHIFDCIRSGPSKDNLTEEEFRQHQRRFHQRQFRPFLRVLFGEYNTYFQKLEVETDAPISDEDYPPVKIKGGHVSTLSPCSPEDLASLKDEDLLAFINKWEDNEDILEGNNLIEVNIEGLSRSFQSAFNEHIVPDPKRHKFWMENYRKIEIPIFVERMIHVMRERVEENDFHNLDEWLQFSEWVLFHSDDSEHEIYDRHTGESRDNPKWSNSRWAVSDFIAACFKKDVNPPSSARGQLANLLDMLCTQFNWRLDQHLTENEPIDEGMHNPRCRALEALVNFGLWLRRGDPAADVPEVPAILEKRLAPEAEHPFTPPEYAILGKNYARIFYLDEAWATAHKSDMFPRTKFAKWLAAFSGFVRYNGPFKPTFEVLRDDFEFALRNQARINKHHRRADQLVYLLGKRLFTFYLWEVYPLTGDESLLEEYYKSTVKNPGHWANLFEHVGRILRDTTEELDSNIKGKIIDFFDWRFTSKEPKELCKFTFWLKAKCLDARWRLNAYSKVLDASKAENMSVAIQIDALCKMLPDYTAEVVACFTKLTDGFTNDTVDIYTEGAKTILKAGIESSNENVRRNAARAHENLLRTGRLDLEALADELADKFMEFAGPDARPLSNHAVSREGIYEDD